MTVSVVLATYNGEHYVEEQLRSIGAQTRRPDEIVIVDDGSSDATLDVVQRVCAQEQLPLRLDAHGRRLGAAANFARGIEGASGDVIVLSDQDDRWLPEKLATIVAAFAAPSPPLGVFSDGWIIDASGVRTNATLWDSFGYANAERHSRDLLTSLLRRNVVTGATLAFSSAARELLLPMDSHGLHDVWIAVLLAAAGDLRPLPDKLVEYRVHDDNTVGLGEHNASRAVRARRGGGQRDELLHYEAMADRVRERGSANEEALRLLERKVAHLRMRCALPRSPLRRALRIGSSLPGYAHYSSSWRSPILDLVAPTRPETA